MAPRSHDMPAWRAFGATLAAFAVGAQLLLSGWLIGQIAAADPSELSVICTHNAGGSHDGGPSDQTSQGQCPACACPFSANLLAPPPEPPSFTVLRPRSQVLRARADFVALEHKFHSPYASRAPPQSA